MAKANGLFGDKVEIGKGPSMVRVRLHDIVYLEGKDCYTIFHLKDKQILSGKHLGFWEGELPETFKRIHRKYLVNRFHICIESTEFKFVKMAYFGILPISRRKLKNL
jgi:DNA-binding LytR/AlgR family response regulator